jgi:hypothetical protein
MVIDYSIFFDAIHTDLEMNSASARVVSSFFSTDPAVKIDIEKSYRRFSELASRKGNSSPAWAKYFDLSPDLPNIRGYSVPQLVGTLPVHSVFSLYGTGKTHILNAEIIRTSEAGLYQWISEPQYISRTRLWYSPSCEDAPADRELRKLRSSLADPLDVWEQTTILSRNRCRIRLYTLVLKQIYFQRLDTGGQPTRKLRLQLLCHFFFARLDDDDEASMAFGIEVVDIHNVNRKKYETEWQNWRGSSISAPTASPLGSEEHSHHRQSHRRKRELRSRFICNGRRQCARVAHSRCCRRCRSRFDCRLYHRRW